MMHRQLESGQVIGISANPNDIPTGGVYCIVIVVWSFIDLRHRLILTCASVNL